VIVLNGTERATSARTVGALLDELALPEGRRGVAVAVEAEVVPRAEWESFELADGARVEVVHAVQGG
jgi:sulfur carrier protein